MTLPPGRIDEIARDLTAALDDPRLRPPITASEPEFDLDAAYAVAERVRELRAARGERAVGRKIGFTNAAVWKEKGLSAPVWNYVFDRTVTLLDGTTGTFDLAGRPEVRLEPEIVLALGAAPRAGATSEALLDAVAWIAHGFEVVYSLFPRWDFKPADAVAAYGVHGGLVVGPRVQPHDRDAWRARLSEFSIELAADDGRTYPGHAGNVLGSPLEALRFLVDDLARRPACRPLAPGEIITTGTLTEAPYVAPGQCWRTRLEGIDLPGLRLALR